MNTFLSEHKNNLDFLLNVSDKSFQDWSNKMDEDDLFYAVFLLRMHMLFVENRINIIKEERKLNKSTEMNNYFYAESIINKIKENLK